MKLNLKAGTMSLLIQEFKELFFLDRLFDIYKIELTENFVAKSWIFTGEKSKYFPVSDAAFILGNTGRIGLVKSVDPLAGNVLYFDKLVMKPISGFVVIGQLSIVAAWTILMLLGGLTWMVAFIRFLVRGSSKNLKMCTYPNMVSVIFLITLVLTIVGRNDPDRFFAQPGILSVSLLLCSIFIVICTIWSLTSLFRSRNQLKRGVIFWHMIVLSFLHLLVTIYLSWFKVIPIMTWT